MFSKYIFLYTPFSWVAKSESKHPLFNLNPKDCPASHPIKIPEIQFFFRIAPYDGGHHQFSDGTGNYHADYFSGWDENFLQDVLDNCENDSEAAMPDAFCEDFLTFREGNKCSQKPDENIVTSLESLQPNPALDVTTITDEATNDTAELPREACSGTLIPAEKNHRRIVNTHTSGNNALRGSSNRPLNNFVNILKKNINF